MLRANFAPSWIALGTFNGKLYGLVFKASNKSTVWYNVPAFKNAGVKPPTTWPQLTEAASTLQGLGRAAVLDRRRGRLDAHRPVREHLPAPGGTGEVRAAHRPQDQVDRPVGDAALKTMAQVLGDSANMAGGTSGAVQTDFPTSVNNVFQNPPKAAMVIEGDFVPGVATVKAKPGTDTASSPSRRARRRAGPGPGTSAARAACQPVRRPPQQVQRDDVLGLAGSGLSALESRPWP